jgi:hypothetical protein
MLNAPRLEATPVLADLDLVCTACVDSFIFAEIGLVWQCRKRGGTYQWLI